MSFRIVEPEHVLATQSADGNWVWSFILEERDGRTRLVSRNRFRLPRLRDRIGMIPMEPGSLVMERKMLYGIPVPVVPVEHDGKRWLVATYGPVA